MKYSYSIQELQINGYKQMYFSLEEKFEPVSNFLNLDINTEEGGTFFINRIKRVLDGKIPIDEVGGNTSNLTIKPEFTEIEEKYLKKRTVKIETMELILLIEAFLREKKRYMNK